MADTCRKSIAPFLNLDFSETAGRIFPPFQLQNMRPFSQGTLPQTQKGGEGGVWWLWVFCFVRRQWEKNATTDYFFLHGNLLLKHRARIWEFTAYLRIQTSITTTWFDCSGCRKLCCWAEKNTKNHVARRKNKWWHDCLSCKSTYLEQNKAKQLCIRFLTPKLLLSLYHSKHLISVLTYMLEGLSLLHSHLQLLIFQECKTLLRITAFQDTICPPTNNDFYSLFLALWPCIWLH